jgi:hypothetical protein
LAVEAGSGDEAEPELEPDAAPESEPEAEPFSEDEAELADDPVCSELPATGESSSVAALAADAAGAAGALAGAALAAGALAGADAFVATFAEAPCSAMPPVEPSAADASDISAKTIASDGRTSRQQSKAASAIRPMPIPCFFLLWFPRARGFKFIFIFLTITSVDTCYNRLVY